MNRLYIIATLAALGAAAGGLWHVSGVYHTAPYKKAAVDAQNAALLQRLRMMRDVEQSTKQDKALQAVIAADLAVTGGQLGSLHRDLAAIASGDTVIATTPVGRAFAGVLGECTSEVFRLA